ncbi:unnamed protein product [Cylicocyclus nassatus]|uniref:SGNH domain-containing protein n=1 Tax=Cylicocyclus nassatus TaxID=53992 RepID=A0AA36H6W8_CYLNA|nr:unnamed protein product [Cylicocyclus nassatus]
MCKIFGVFAVGYFYVLRFDRKQILDDLTWAYTYSSNLQPIFQKLGYWDQLSTYRFFVHAWSLGVELQYYLIVPFIMGVALCFGHNARIKLFSTIGVFSVIFQLYAPPKVSYGFLLSRIWQFMCGSIAYEFSKPFLSKDKSLLRQEEKNSSENAAYKQDKTELSYKGYKKVNWAAMPSATGMYLPKQIDKAEIGYTIEWNLRESRKKYFAMPCSKDGDTQRYTNYKNNEPELQCVAKGNATAKVLVLGNSIAYRAYPLIHNILKGRYRSLRLFPGSGCPSLSNWCAALTKATKKVVQHEKPDIVLYMHHSLKTPFVAPVKDLKKDRIYKEFQGNIDFISKYAKHIVIDMPYYTPPFNVGAKLARRLQLGLLPGDEFVVTWEVSTHQPNTISSTAAEFTELQQMHHEQHKRGQEELLAKTGCH